MHDDSGAGHSRNHRLLIHQIDFDELKLIEELLAIRLLEWVELRSVALVTYRATDGETAVLEEEKAHVRAEVSRDAGDCHDWFGFGHATVSDSCCKKIF